MAPTIWPGHRSGFADTPPPDSEKRLPTCDPIQEPADVTPPHISAQKWPVGST